MKVKIYLDFNSTHPPIRPVLQTARDFYFEHFANSSGLSLESQAVNARIEEARAEIAGLLSLHSRQIVFTSCATESNNLLIRSFHENRKNKTFKVLSSPFEHPSVSECLKALPDTETTFLPSDRHGVIDPAGFAAMPWLEYDLITMMAVQNESGVVLPLEKLIAALPENHPPVIADFSQALPKLAADAEGILKRNSCGALTQNNIFLTATGHKVGAGFGAGLIITPAEKSKSKNMTFLSGGNQEHAQRAGSHNVEAIIALAEALKLKSIKTGFEKWQTTTSAFEKILIEKISPVHTVSVVGERANRAPGTTLLLLSDVAIDFLIMALDREGITVSTGTSCKSRSRSPSSALLAMGYSEGEALSVIRLSYDENLTEAEMVLTAEAIAAAIQKLA